MSCFVSFASADGKQLRYQHRLNFWQRRLRRFFGSLLLVENGLLKRKRSQRLHPLQFFANYNVLLHFTHKFMLKADLLFAFIEEQFYGNPQKRIKGACEMLILGEGPFRALYNIIEGKLEQELVLKVSCCGKDTASLYVAGVHFSVEDLLTFGVNKKVKCRQLWLMGLTVMRLMKKAFSIVPKHVPLICIINKKCGVISYASGWGHLSTGYATDKG